MVKRGIISVKFDVSLNNRVIMLVWETANFLDVSLIMNPFLR